MWYKFLEQLGGGGMLGGIAEYKQAKLMGVEFVFVEGQQGVVQVFLGIGAGVAVGEDEFTVAEGEDDGGLFMEPEHAHAFFVVGVGIGDGEQSFCQVVLGTIGWQGLGVHRWLKSQGDVGVDFSLEAGLESWNGCFCEGLGDELQVAVEINPGDVGLELCWVFCDLVAQGLLLRVEREVMHHIVVIHAQDLVHGAGVLGLVFPERIHVDKVN